MPRFYFHQRSDTESVSDLEGAHYRDIESAVEDAIEGARQLMAGRVLRGLGPDGWRFEITGQRGEILAVVPFKETISDNGHIDPAQVARWYRIDAI